VNFELENQKAKLANFNARSELNGEDRAPAADVKLEMALTADDLAMFSPELRACLYDGSNKLRNPQLGGPLSWESEIVGATMIIHFGLGGKSDVIIDGCVVNGFKLTPQDGGTVIASVRVQCHPSEKEAGRLYSLVQAEVEVSLKPAQSELALGTA
jgi:hypothetical protein